MKEIQKSLGLFLSSLHLYRNAVGTVQVFVLLEPKFRFFVVFYLLYPVASEHRGVLKVLYALTYLPLMFVSLLSVFIDCLSILLCLNYMEKTDRGTIRKDFK